jgi:hypothetical protein
MGLKLQVACTLNVLTLNVLGFESSQRLADLLFAKMQVWADEDDGRAIEDCNRELESANFIAIVIQAHALNYYVVVRRQNAGALEICH